MNGSWFREYMASTGFAQRREIEVDLFKLTSGWAASTEACGLENHAGNFPVNAVEREHSGHSNTGQTPGPAAAAGTS